jgi:hypothetical protein
MLLAGRAAQREFHRGAIKEEALDRHAAADLEQARTVLGVLEEDEAARDRRLWNAEALARALVCKYWALILAVAEHLEVHRTVTGEELLHLIQTRRTR